MDKFITPPRIDPNKPMLDIKLYDYMRPSKPPKKELPPLFKPAFTEGPYFPPQWQMPPYLYEQNKMPILQKYNINIQGPQIDHRLVSNLYEDILPEKEFSNTSNTLKERLSVYQFARNTFIEYDDGENIDLSGKTDKSLLNFLKLIEINPYNPNNFSDNPYKGLADNILIYRSCYPIRYTSQFNATTCARNAIGMNVRIYNLTNEEYRAKEEGRIKKYNVWREVLYYEYIRDYIIKKNICPNFSILYSYFISNKSGIDFNKLRQIKNKAINNLRPDDVNLTSDSGNALIALTEGPTYNFINWASKRYEVNGGINKMTRSGHHSDEIWMSVLFQIAAALYVLQINNIAFNNFTLEDNVYIKDIRLKGNVTNYWKYRINGIDYYVPNYGYFVMIDSNFKDNVRESRLLESSEDYKLYGSIFKDDGFDESKIKEKAIESFKNATNTNNFSVTFRENGGIKPSENITSLMDNLNSDDSGDISGAMEKYMRNYMNNRIGTLLKENEINNIRRDEVRNFKKGDIVVHEVQHDTYMFVLYLSDRDNKATILTGKEPIRGIVEKKDIIEKEVPKDILFNYSKYEIIQQNYDVEKANLNEEKLLETYIIN